MPLSPNTLSTSSDTDNNTLNIIQSPDPKASVQTMSSLSTQIISPVMRNNSLPFIRKSEVVKKLVMKYPSVEFSESNAIVPRRLSKDDIAKLGYAMKVYKHIKIIPLKLIVSKDISFQKLLLKNYNYF